MLPCLIALCSSNTGPHSEWSPVGEGQVLVLVVSTPWSKERPVHGELSSLPQPGFLVLPLAILTDTGLPAIHTSHGPSSPGQ